MYLKIKIYLLFILIIKKSKFMFEVQYLLDFGLLILFILNNIIIFIYLILTNLKKK
jgi:hypothetical protein